MTGVWSGLGCSWRRNASVLVWTGPLLLGPVLDLHGSPGSIVFQVAMIVVIGVSAITVGLTGGPPWRDPRPYVALSTLVAATFAGATLTHNYWLPTWVLLANALPCVLRGRWLFGGIAVTVGLSCWAAWAVVPHQWSRVYQEGFIVLLAGLASSAFVALLDTIAELRRTRQELARIAVVEERERFSRDLHDLLGHTLSVMVVKAQAVRRLVAQDPDAAAGHAADIEQIGRRALVDVRQAVDAMRAPSLSEELDGARARPRRGGHRDCRSTGPTSTRPGRQTSCWRGWCARERPTCCGTPGRRRAGSSSPTVMAGSP